MLLGSGGKYEKNIASLAWHTALYFSSSLGDKAKLANQSIGVESSCHRGQERINDSASSCLSPS